nr:hypothetical protein GCM10020093_037050 [Planobispora longispora]
MAFGGGPPAAQASGQLGAERRQPVAAALGAVPGGQEGGVRGVGGVPGRLQRGQVGFGLRGGGDQLRIGQLGVDGGALPVERAEAFGLVRLLGGRPDRRASVLDPEESRLGGRRPGPRQGRLQLGRGGPLLPGGLGGLPEQFGLVGQPLQPGGQRRVLPGPRRGARPSGRPRR